MDFKIELIPLAVQDVDRSVEFYGRASAGTSTTTRGSAPSCGSCRSPRRARRARSASAPGSR